MGRLFVVIGLGRFGAGVARTLLEEGQTVLGLDSSLARIQEMSHFLSRVARCNATDIESLRVLGVPAADTAVVAIGDSMEASILCTLNLKELGVPRVVAKAVNEQHGKALERVGADRVVYPQRDMGVRVAHNLVAAQVRDYVRLSPSHSMLEVEVSARLAGKTLRELALPHRFNCTAVAVQRGRRVITPPGADERLREGDLLVVIGPDKGLQELEEAS